MKPYKKGKTAAKKYLDTGRNIYCNNPYPPYTPAGIKWVEGWRSVIKNQDGWLKNNVIK